VSWSGNGEEGRTIFKAFNVGRSFTDI
jgi:hypothetical protein